MGEAKLSLAWDSGMNRVVSEVNTLERVAKDKGNFYCPLTSAFI